MLRALFIVGLGGFIGTCIRFLTYKLCEWYFTVSYPWATFIVNLIGSFLIGVIWGLIEKTHLLPSEIGTFMVIGICGGLTTFSAFSNDSFMMIQNRQWLNLFVYVLCSVFLSIFLVWLGRYFVKPDNL